MSIHKLNLAELAAAKAMIEAARTVTLNSADAALFAAYIAPGLSMFRAKVDCILKEHTVEVEP